MKYLVVAVCLIALLTGSTHPKRLAVVDSLSHLNYIAVVLPSDIDYYEIAESSTPGILAALRPACESEANVILWPWGLPGNFPRIYDQLAKCQASGKTVYIAFGNDPKWLTWPMYQDVAEVVGAIGISPAGAEIYRDGCAWDCSTSIATTRAAIEAWQ